VTDGIPLDELVGRAQRGDTVMDNWFVLVREDPAG
jgi:hypothetical protein